MDVVGFESGTVGLDQEATNLVIFVFDLRPNHGHVGNRAGGDPHLLAVEHVLFADFAGTGTHAAGVGAEIRLG